MQQSVYIISKSAQSKWRNLCVVGALLLSLVGGNPAAQAENVPALMKMKGFSAVVMAIARLNMAMQIAAKNPLNDPYRLQVRQAMAALPIAIAMLAQDFRDNKLHDSDLSPILKVLGGFVDRSAPQKFDQFLKKPDLAFIPKVGNNFPQVSTVAASGSGNSGSYYMDEGASKNGSSTGSNSVSGAAATNPAEFANLSDAGSAGTASQNSGAPSLLFDENASNDGSTSGNVSSWNPAAATGVAASDASGLSRGDDSLQQANSDLLEVENALKGQSNNPQSDLDDDYFRGPASNDKLKQKQRQNRKLRPRAESSDSKSELESFQLSVTPKYWQPVPAEILRRLFVFSSAHADPPVAPSPTGQGQGQGGQGDQHSGNCPGGGGAGGGGGNSGGGAADFLFGLAAIMAAGAPIVAAAVTANAQNQQAQIAAQTNLQIAQMKSDTQMQVAQMQQQQLAQQLQNSNLMNQQNNAAAMQRVNMEVSAAEQQTNMQYQLQQTKDQVAQQAQTDQIELQQLKTANDQKLAQAQASAQYEAAGLMASGVAGTGNKLVITYPGGNTSSLAGNGTSLGSVLANRGGTLASNTGGSSGGISGGSSAGGISGGGGSAMLEALGPNKALLGASQSVSGNAASKLLASVSGEKTATQTPTSSFTMGNYVHGVALKSVIVPATLRSLLSSNNRLQRGSTSTAMVKLSAQEMDSDSSTSMDSSPIVVRSATAARNLASTVKASPASGTNNATSAASRAIRTATANTAAFSAIGPGARGADASPTDSSGAYNPPAASPTDANLPKVLTPGRSLAK